MFDPGSVYRQYCSLSLRSSAGRTDSMDSFYGKLSNGKRRPLIAFIPIRLLPHRPSGDGDDADGAKQPRWDQRVVLGPVLPGGERHVSRGAGFISQNPFRPACKDGAVRYRQWIAGSLRRDPFAVGRQHVVADQAIGPQVDNVYSQLVRTGTQNLGDADTERRLPQNAEVVTIEFGLSDHRHAPQVKIEATAIGSESGRQLEPLMISGGSGKMLHAGMGMIGPGD